MTPRQREFCRHYLRGLSAPRAASAAGYSACTAEKNAATILRSASVARYLEHNRALADLVTVDDLLEGKALMKQIMAGDDKRAAAMAYNALIRLRGMQAQIASELSALPGSENHLNTTQIIAQVSDNQEVNSLENTPEILSETDTLSTGLEAYDKTIGSIKADVVKPITPVNIVFRTVYPKKQPKHVVSS